MQRRGTIKVYTRQPDAECYLEGLAYSIHMAVSMDGERFRPLNKSYGILFAKAQIRQDDTLCPKGVREPWVFQIGQKEYGIAALRTHENGRQDKEAEGMAYKRTLYCAG